MPVFTSCYAPRENGGVNQTYIFRNYTTSPFPLHLRRYTFDCWFEVSFEYAMTNRDNAFTKVHPFTLNSPIDPFTLDTLANKEALCSPQQKQKSIASPSPLSLTAGSLLPRFQEGALI